MAEKDLYQVLGVSRGASEQEIKKAYRKLAKELHPDRTAGDKAKEERFKDVSAAYEVLSDAKKKSLYDRYGHVGLREGFDPAMYEAYQQGGGGPGGMPFDLGDFFRAARGAGGVHTQGPGFGGAPFDLGDLFGGHVAGGRGHVRSGRDVEADLTIDFRDAVLGCERELTFQTPGHVPHSLKVRIPPGARDGRRIRLAGKGRPGHRGGPPGDAILTLHVEKHPHFWFEPEDEDLQLRLPITAAEAYLGAKIEVTTPEGPVQLRIPAGAQTGQKLRLREKGVKRRDGSRSDLIVHLAIRIPKERSAELDAAFEKIREAMTEDPRADVQL
ncbi:MAG: J domain-containing protein [Polyangiales bacterium]